MDWLVVLTFFVGLGTSVISGMGGGGGGFVIMPYFLFIGLPPAFSLATAKFGGVGTSVGAITAFRGKGLVNKKLVVPFMAITFICAIISAWLIPQIDTGIFEKVIGIVLIAMIPTLFIKKVALQPGHRTRGWIVAGYVGFILFSFLQTLIGTGMGAMVVLVLMYLFGLNALEANATKRVSQSVQAIILVILLGLQGFLNWPHAIAAFLGATIGSHYGAHIAIKKGNAFVKIMLAVVMAVSGVALLIW